MADMRKRLSKAYPDIPERTLNWAVTKAFQEVPKEDWMGRFRRAKELIVVAAQRDLQPSKGHEHGKTG